MMHEFFEIPLPTIFTMPDNDFLILCGQYLEDAIPEQNSRRIEFASSEYGRDLEREFGFDLGYGSSNELDVYGGLV